MARLRLFEIQARRPYPAAKPSPTKIAVSIIIGCSPSHTVTEDENYRSTPPILMCATLAAPGIGRGRRAPERSTG